MPGIDAPVVTTWSPWRDVAVEPTDAVNADDPDELDSDGLRSATAALAKALTEDAALDERTGDATGEGASAKGWPRDGEAPEPYRTGYHPETSFCFVNPLRRSVRGT